jgi:hypothetical protein
MALSFLYRSGGTGWNGCLKREFSSLFEKRIWIPLVVGGLMVINGDLMMVNDD